MSGQKQDHKHQKLASDFASYTPMKTYSGPPSSSSGTYAQAPKTDPKAEAPKIPTEDVEQGSMSGEPTMKGSGNPMTTGLKIYKNERVGGARSLFGSRKLLFPSTGKNHLERGKARLRVGHGLPGLNLLDMPRYDNDEPVVVVKDEYADAEELDFEPQTRPATPKGEPIGKVTRPTTPTTPKGSHPAPEEWGGFGDDEFMDEPIKPDEAAMDKVGNKESKQAKPSQTPFESMVLRLATPAVAAQGTVVEAEAEAVDSKHDSSPGVEFLSRNNNKITQVPKSLLEVSDEDKTIILEDLLDRSKEGTAGFYIVSMTIDLFAGKIDRLRELLSKSDLVHRKYYKSVLKAVNPIVSISTKGKYKSIGDIMNY